MHRRCELYLCVHNCLINYWSLKLAVQLVQAVIWTETSAVHGFKCRCICPFKWTQERAIISNSELRSAAHELVLGLESLPLCLLVSSVQCPKALSWALFYCPYTCFPIIKTQLYLTLRPDDFNPFSYVFDCQRIFNAGWLITLSIWMRVRLKSL